MKKIKQPGSRTMLWSVIISAPGPLVVGIGLLFGHSSSQIAVFIRRSAELLAIITSFVVFKITSAYTEDAAARKARLERISNIFSGAMMCLGGSIMILLAFMADSSEKGNVIPGLIITLMGLITNIIFWCRYARLSRENKNAILIVQARLYRAKTFVDACVTAALLSVTIAPESAISTLLDLVGSVIVAIYLTWCGIKSIWENAKKKLKPGDC